MRLQIQRQLLHRRLLDRGLIVASRVLRRVSGRCQQCQSVAGLLPWRWRLVMVQLLRRGCLVVIVLLRRGRLRMMVMRL